MDGGFEGLCKKDIGWEDICGTIFARILAEAY
jgi:hypothetical protein